MITHTLSKHEFLQFQSAFKARATSGKNQAADMLVYNIIRGKDPKRGFTAITNTNKLNNGAGEWFGFTQAKYNALLYIMSPKKRELFKDKYTVEFTDEQFAVFQAILKGL
jgi:hypothetical protein